MGKKDLYFILAFALLLGANLYVKYELMAAREPYHEWYYHVGHLEYEYRKVIEKKDDYIRSDDVVRCNKTAKKLESLCRKKDEATRRKYVMERLSEHNYNKRLEYFSSQCKEEDVSFDLIDSLAIVLYAERRANE